MKKKLLFKKLSSYKIPLMVLLLTVCTCYGAFAQNKQITGKVTSADDGSPFPGVSVRLKGTNLGAVTDVNGVFNISASNGSVLTFSFIGYSPQEVTVGGGSIYNVQLSANAKTLAEVSIVSIGYGTSKRSDLTGSISSVSAKQIEAVPVTSLEQALQGRAAGVQVTNNDGTPGANVTVLIRGTGSLASYANGPLYIIDGFPSSEGLNNINTDDIASIDILKDASATAIYGIRAANGVVLVTTKRGKKNSVQVSADGYNAFQMKPKMYKVLNATQFATLANKIASDPSQNLTPIPLWTNPASLHTLDFQNAVYQTSLTQNYTLAIRGGSDKVQQATSFGYYDQKGAVYGSYFKRATFSTNVDYEPIKWLKSSTNVKYTFQDSRNPYGTGTLMDLAALVPTMDGGNKLTNEIKAPDGHGGYNYGFYNPTVPRIDGAGGNPIYGTDTNHQYNLNYAFLANTSLEATIFDGLKVKTNIGINTTNFAGQYYQPVNTVVAAQYPGRVNTTAFYSQNMNQDLTWLMENTLAYDKTFGKHSISFLAGFSAQKEILEAMGGSGIPPNSVIRDLGQVSALVLNPNGNGTTIQALESYFGRVAYNYDDRYFITATVRRDGSSKFDANANAQFGTFPSAGAKWKAKNESFLKNVSWLSDLNFRGTWGRVGNQQSIAPFQYLALYNGNFPATTSSPDNLGYPFNKIYQNGLTSYQPANPNLRWETDTQTDVGVDAAFLNGDLTLTADWYDRKSKDFLLTLAAPAQSGYNTLTENVGSMDNKGVEFALSYQHRATTDFKFGATLTLSANKNTLTSLQSGATSVQNFGGLALPTLQGWTPFSQTAIGQPVGEFYGFKSLGIFQSQPQIDALNAAAAKYGAGTYYQHSVTVPGDRYFADTNGDGIVNDNDRISLGSPQPKFYGGLSLDATYKAWDFTMYFYGTYGNKIFSFAESNIESFGSRQNGALENVSQAYYAGAWTPQNHSNVYSRVTANDDAEGSSAASSAWIENGSFLKLKTLNIGYTLPVGIAKKVLLTKLRLYVSSQNLFTITSYKGLDPEIGTQGGNPTQNGIDNGAYPYARSITFGLNATL
ncbi:MAG: TonB-dependent receptor [Bacteroidota bacterium]|nr:TonB-dependent receptor [Bacteroidota bacterium]